MRTTEPVTCPTCQRVSYHHDDVKYGWCGGCEAFTRGNLIAPLGANRLPRRLCVNMCGAWVLADAPTGQCAHCILTQEEDTRAAVRRPTNARGVAVIAAILLVLWAGIITIVWLVLSAVGVL